MFALGLEELTFRFIKSRNGDGAGTVHIHQIPVHSDGGVRAHPVLDMV